jgi:hypothetical protein
LQILHGTTTSVFSRLDEEAEKDKAWRSPAASMSKLAVGQGSGDHGKSMALRHIKARMRGFRKLARKGSGAKRRAAVAVATSGMPGVRKRRPRLLRTGCINSTETAAPLKALRRNPEELSLGRRPRSGIPNSPALDPERQLFRKSAERPLGASAAPDSPEVKFGRAESGSVREPESASEISESRGFEKLEKQSPVCPLACRPECQWALQA